MNAVEINNISYSYNKHHLILNGLNSQIQRGKIYALLGPSGCGKTTLLRIILGRIEPVQGSVQVLNSEPGTSITLKRIGYMPQDVSLIDQFTAKENMIYYGQLYRMTKREIIQRIKQLFQMLEIEHHSSSNNSNCYSSEQHLKLNQLSGGQQRRVSLAVALIHSPELLILDEPTVGQDPLLRDQIWNYLLQCCNQKRITVIITTHYTQEATMAHTVGFLRNGKMLMEDDPKQLLKKYHETQLDEVFFKLCTELDQQEVDHHQEQQEKNEKYLNSQKHGNGIPKSGNGISNINGIFENGIPVSENRNGNGITGFTMSELTTRLRTPGLTSGLATGLAANLTTGLTPANLTSSLTTQSVAHELNGYSNGDKRIQEVIKANLKNGQKFSSNKIKFKNPNTNTKTKKTHNVTFDIYTSYVILVKILFVIFRKHTFFLIIIYPIFAIPTYFVIFGEINSIKISVFNEDTGSMGSMTPLTSASTSSLKSMSLSQYLLNLYDSKKFHQINVNSLEQAINLVKRGDCVAAIWFYKNFSQSIYQRYFGNNEGDGEHDIDNNTVQASNVHIYMDNTYPVISNSFMGHTNSYVNNLLAKLYLENVNAKVSSDQDAEEVTASIEDEYTTETIRGSGTTDAPGTNGTPKVNEAPRASDALRIKTQSSVPRNGSEARLSLELTTTNISSGSLQSSSESILIPSSTPIVIKETIYGQQYKDDNLLYIDIILPGIIISTVFINQIVLSMLQLMSERSSGLERTLLSGAGYLEIITAHFTVCLIISLIQTTFVLIICFIVFDRPNYGSYLLILLLTFTQDVSGITFGFFISSFCQEYVTGLILSYAINWTTVFMSPILWPIEANQLKSLSYLSPMTLPILSLQSILSKGWPFCNLTVFSGFAYNVILSIFTFVLTIVIYKFKKI